MTLQDVVAKFNTTPFLFVGSGISKRYYNLPNWEELLKSFAERINDDRFAYAAYRAKAQEADTPNGLLPMVATLIQHDFEPVWFTKKEMRTLNEAGLNQVENGVSPFKAEIASLILKKSVLNAEYEEEIKLLKRLSKKNLAGVITTNYDMFFETLFEDYKSFVGQDELVFSPIQGIAEIYKIHGSITKPASIVINNQDYQIFNEKNKYLAAKLMTIFMEYPIVFMGYSIGDQNIRNILTDIVACLPDNKFEKLQERFIFVEYKKALQGVAVSPYSIDLNGRLLNMTRVSIDNFALLYEALATKEAKISVKLLRRFKEEIYTYVISTRPGPLMQVAQLDDTKIDEDRLCISIGLTNTGEYGLKNIIDAEKWYRDIITDELNGLGFSYTQRLELSFSSTFRNSNGLFPVHKYLANAEGDFPNVYAHAAKTFEDLISTTLRKRRSKVNYSSVKELWEHEKLHLNRATELLSCLPEEKIDVEELRSILVEIFSNNENVLSEGKSGLATNIRRLIRIYDFLRWGKKKDLSTKCLTK